MKPDIPITDSRFAYTSSDHTDIAKRFAAVRLEQERARRDKEHAEERAYDATRELIDRSRA